METKYNIDTSNYKQLHDYNIEYQMKHQQEFNFLKPHLDDLMSTSKTYPHSDKYEFSGKLEIINYDKACEDDLREGNGFIVEPAGRNIKKDLRAEDGIFSPKFGQTLADTNPFMDRYHCRCKEGGLRGRINYGLRCPQCGHLCTYVDDNFKYCGWIKLSKPYKFIHPTFYIYIESILGKGIYIQGNKRTKLENILDVTDTKLVLNTMSRDDPKLKDEPFFGIGMIEFTERFDEIMDYYIKKYPNKKSYYDAIYESRESVFSSSLPVITTLLRPFDIDGNNMTYEPTNGMYAMINKLATSINKNKTAIQREPNIKNQQLYNLQKKFMEIYAEQISILAGKKGDFRCLLGGRYNFSSRCVIVQNPNLRIDEITMPAVALTVMLEQRIKNILCRMHGMTPTEAHDIWYKATIEPNKKINTIIQSIIDDFKHKGMRGLPVIIGRNPTLAYGSILQMFCVGITNTYTLAVPLQILKFLAADFDGDVIYCLVPMNQTFIRLAWEKFNPRNAMYISRDNGYFNANASMQRDTLINANTLARLGRENYTQEEIAKFDRIFNAIKSH